MTVKRLSNGFRSAGCAATQPSSSVRQVRRVEACAGRLWRRADEGRVAVETVPRSGVDAEEGEGVRRPLRTVSRLGGQPPPQRGILLGDLAQEDVAEGPRGVDQLGQDARFARVEQRVVVVDGRARQLRQPLGDVRGEAQAGDRPRARGRSPPRIAFMRAESSIIFAEMGGSEALSVEVDRAALAASISPQPRALGVALRRDSAGGLRVAADRAAQSDLLLRGPHPGLRRQHAPEARARRPLSGFGLRGPLRTRASIPRRPSPFRRRRRRGRRASRSAATPRPPIAASWTRFAHRDIADPGNPVLARGLAAFTILEHEPMHQETLLLHVAPAAVRPEDPSRGARAAENRRRAAAAPQHSNSGRLRHARRGRGGALRLGQRAGASPGRRAGVFDRRCERDEPGLSRVRRGGRVPDRIPLGRRGLGVAIRERRAPSALLGVAPRPLVLARDVGSRSASRCPGRST